MEHHCDDDDEDSRKPAARPTVRNPTFVLDAMNSTTTALPTTTMVPSSCTSAAELPFLVTHWLAGLATATDTVPVSHMSALLRIQQAAGDLAEAFTALGAFGTTIKVS